MHKKTSKKLKHKTGGRRDGEEKKRFPNSVAAMVRAIYKSWLYAKTPNIHPNEMSARDFIQKSNFSEIYGRVLKRYRGVSRPRKPTKGLIDDMGRGEDSDLEYYRLRAFADFVGIPDHAFLLFARFVSIERRLSSHEERVAAFNQKIAALKRLVRTAEDFVTEANEETTLFSKVDGHESDGSEIWLADIQRLHRWCDSYKDGDLSTVIEAEEKH